ncbi:WD40 repeat domain-containing protein [Streptomyces uncialis]|uniref:WD40 repeat domain-containing protein n=1 Tax=Streptomyces uncialis TaxID=1048205 RepID=UPI0038695BD2|nr:WD40 repeat domain-containing protein [Streptomyces uncialis]
MNVENVLRSTLRERAEHTGPAPADLADRVLGARRRRRRVRWGLSVLVALTATGLALGQTLGGSVDTRPASERDKRDVIGRADQSPPRQFVAAGDTALAAHYTIHWADVSSQRIGRRDYQLLDQRTGTYRPVPWRYLDVAPGLRTAAVLEQDLPARRVGLVDMTTGKVTRWIDLPGNKAGAVAFSPDGDRLVATTYDGTPEEITLGQGSHFARADARRTGFWIIDLRSGRTEWHRAPDEAEYTSFIPRRDFDWSSDGRLVRSPNDQTGYDYYDLKGGKATAPTAEKHLTSHPGGVSPDGTLVAGEPAGNTTSWLIDARTGARKDDVPGSEFLAWADDRTAVFLGCRGLTCKDWDKRVETLLLVDVRTDRVEPLSGERPMNKTEKELWQPVFAPR